MDLLKVKYKQPCLYKHVQSCDSYSMRHFHNERSHPITLECIFVESWRTKKWKNYPTALLQWVLYTNTSHNNCMYSAVASEYVHKTYTSIQDTTRFCMYAIKKAIYCGVSELELRYNQINTLILPCWLPSAVEIVCRRH